MSLEKFMSIEMIAVMSCKSTVYFRWNGWQNIIIEIEYGDTGMDKVDDNSQYLETYDAMRKTTESEREAKDPITTSTYATEDDDIVGFSFLLSKFGFLEGPKVEAEILSVKMHQTEAISWRWRC